MNRLPYALGMTLVLVLLGIAPSARAAEPPATPTITALSVASPVVPDGEDVEVQWTGDDGGVELFVVRATYRDADWNLHEVVDGVGDDPTTGVMRATVDSTWASGLAIPTKVEIFDIGGDGRVYYADDERTPEDESRTVVYYGGQDVSTEYDGPDLFSDAALSIREEIIDSEAPRLTSISLAQRTGHPGETVTLNWAGEDDHSGIRFIRVLLRGSDGTTDELIEEFVYGKPPTSGQIQIPVPQNAVEGISEVMGLGIADNACNERFYQLRPPDAQAMSGTAWCGLGYVDPETRVPDDLSIAPLAFGVIVERPEMQVPDSPRDLLVTWQDGQWHIDWSSASAWQNNTRQFYDWIYHVEVDDEVTAYPWPDTEYTIFDDDIGPGGHTVRVRAVNRFGPSSWSAPLTFSTEPSGPIENLSSSGRLWGGRLDWTPPSTGEAAHHYLVVKRPGTRTLEQMPQPASTQEGVTGTRFEATHLDPSRNYTFVVYAVGAQGQISAGTLTHLTGTRLTVRAADLRPRAESELRGRVIDTNGNGVPGVRVLVQGASSSDPAVFGRTGVATTTAADGRYRVSFTPKRGFQYRVATPGGLAFGPSWSSSLT